MQRRAVGVALLFLLVTSFHGLANQGSFATAYALGGAPVVPGPSIKAPATSFLSHWTPVQLLIPRISVDASVEGRGLDSSRNLDTPRDFHDVAWYNLGPAPGRPGNALINGHVNWWTGSAVFARLSHLRPGDEVFVVREDGSQLAFKVTARTIVAAGARLPSLFAPSQAATLTLITCTGVWDKARGTDTQRLLVSAVVE